MIALIARRLLTLALTAWLATLVVFVVLDLLPGDPALLVLGTEAQPDTLAVLRERMGLDLPAWQRYAAWIGGMLQGDFGVSYTYDRPVATLIAERLVVSLPLAVLALLSSIIIAIPMGLLAASRQDQPADWLVMGFGQLGVAVPNFWFAILLILGFSVHLHWFAANGFPGWGAGIGPGLKALVLPTVALALPEAAILARITRSAVLDTLREDYVRTALAKGVSKASIMVRHVLPNALIPISTVLGLQFAFLIAGAVVVENVFDLPGLGRLLYQAINQHDLMVVRSVVVLLAMFVVLVNALVDVAYAIIDPRPRVET